MPPTLGQRLKHAREKRGLTLRDVEHTTRIPMAKLQDLEDDKLNTFGGMTYAKSFLRTYATLLDVSADDVLNQMKPPPLSGMRDYRYLVETQGLWIADRSDQRPLAQAPTLSGPGRSFVMAVMVCFGFSLLIGGGLLANAYFNAKPSATTVAQDDGAAAKSALDDGTAAPQGAYVSAADLADEQEFNVVGVSLTLVPDKTMPAPPKAQPVNETTAVPKAVPVR
jgi:transcriptional regulator with XRE-family HTH domain